MLITIVFGFCVASVLAEEVCYEPCGCFNNDPPFDDRPLPESPEDQQIVWMLFTRSNPDVHEEIHWDLPVPDVFDPSKTTNFLIHGWTDSPGMKDDSERDPFFPTMLELKDAILSKHDNNVIVVDWSVGAGHINYPLSASNTRVVGFCSGYLANDITDVGTVHCTGHSLGGQTCGYMGYSTNGALGIATGLDPAGPWFDVEESEVRLDASDAQFVDAHHTNGQGVSLGLGQAIGHADFYPHLGGSQPPCQDAVGNGSTCDHSICKGYYYASIMEDDCTFQAYPCNTEADANAGLCNSCTDGVDCQSMSYYSVQYPGTGTFYLEVNSDYPYCRN